jgi:hypothetical protein
MSGLSVWPWLPWKVAYIRRKYKQLGAQKRQPIPTIVKRFTPPDNHQEESAASHFTGLVEKTTTVKNKTRCISKPQRNKILIIGDSHAYLTKKKNYLIL